VKKIRCPNCSAELIMESGKNIVCNYCSTNISYLDLDKIGKDVKKNTVTLTEEPPVLTMQEEQIEKSEPSKVEEPDAIEDSLVENSETFEPENFEKTKSIFIDEEQRDLYYLTIELLDKNDVKTAKSKINIFSEEYPDTYLYHCLTLKYELRYLKTIAENIVPKLTDVQSRALNKELVELILDEKLVSSGYHLYLMLLNSNILKFIEFVEVAVGKLRSNEEKEVLLDDMNGLLIAASLFDLNKENSDRLVDVYQKLISAKFGLFNSNDIKKLSKTKFSEVKNLIRNANQIDIFNKIYGIIS
jgi:DNA-directed RNA polymerase subunit RPC12/RpoP